MIDWKRVQTRLAGVYSGVIDGLPGPLTYKAVLTRLAGHATPLMTEIGKALAANVPAYQVDADPERLAQFLGQCTHESQGFSLMRETWGPTAAQRGYDASGNSLGNHPGDGFDLRGAGAIEVTGRRNFVAIGKALNLDLVGNPPLLDDPGIGVLISLEWWRANGMNALADSGDTVRVSKAVNCGSPDAKRSPNGLASRVAFTNIARGIVA